MKSCEREFLDNIARVRKEAHRAARRYGMDFAEMFAEASLHFVVACKSFDESRRAKITSWATFKMRKGIESRARLEARRERLLPRVGLKDMAAKERWDIKAFAESLSRDALLAVRAALLSNEGSDYRMRREVVRRLRKKNWTRERIEAAFAEVRSALES